MWTEEQESQNSNQVTEKVQQTTQNGKSQPPPPAKPRRWISLAAWAPEACDQEDDDLSASISEGALRAATAHAAILSLLQIREKARKGEAPQSKERACEGEERKTDMDRPLNWTQPDKTDSGRCVLDQIRGTLAHF